MKKLLSFLAIMIGLNFCLYNGAYAQDDDVVDTTTKVVDTSKDTLKDDVKTDNADNEPSVTITQAIKDKFIEGGWEFMTMVLICLILGLAIAVERIITLNLATTNTESLIRKIDDALKTGGTDAALKLCQATSGPVASIFAQGLLRADEGIEMIEKAVVGYGTVEMGRLEKGLSWISLFISLAPMLGFLGTVIGMIGAFDAIERAGEISANLVAGGIKVALITTVGGLIVAIILQIFYNYCVSKIDSIVNDMEDASVSLIDVLVENKVVRIED